MATWPSTLDQSLLSAGFSLTQQDQTIRTPMSAGPDFVRRRFTAAATPFNGAIQATPAQHDLFWDFFNNTLHGGADEFTWKHPITGDSASIRFVGVPTVTSVAAGILFQISMQLEILP